MSCFFSIIIPCYNRSDIILSTIQAVLKQEYQNFEIIIVDDGSVDNTNEVVRAVNDLRVRYFYKQNEERGAARNFGARQARGQYVNFFDSDDEMYSNHLQVVKNFLDAQGEVEVIHTGYEVIAESGEVIHEVCDFRKSTNKELIHNNFLACNTVFLRKDIALTNPFVEDRRLASAEDWELWLRLASKYTFYSVNAKTFCLREHSNRSLNTISPDAVLIRDQLFAHLMGVNKDFCKFYQKQVSYFIANRYTFITLMLALSKNRKYDTLRFLHKAFIVDPTVLWRRRFLASIKHLIVK